MKGINRRQILTTGTAAAVGMAAAATASINANANTTNPPESEPTAANPEGRFAGKVVLITGATSGIGRATAEEFAREGATVVFNGRRKDLGAEVVRGIQEFGGQAEYVQSDMGDPAQVQSFIDGAVSRYGQIDIAFNNAGIAIPPGPIEEVDPASYQELMAINLDGVFWSMHHEVRHMKKSGGGVIINTSSAFGSHAANTQTPYGASRAAVNSLTEAVAKEVGGDNIRVLAVAPGAIINTDLFRFMGRPWNQDEIDFMGTLHGVGRPGQPIEVARMVLALASDDATFVHGTVIPVDGQFLQA